MTSSADDGPGSLRAAVAAASDGGNLEWPLPSARSRVADRAIASDPLVGPWQAMDGTLVVPLLDGSPAPDAAVDPTLDRDGRGAPRADGAADTGAYELGASCSG